MWGPCIEGRHVARVVSIGQQWSLGALNQPWPSCSQPRRGEAHAADDGVLACLPVLGGQRRWLVKPVAGRDTQANIAMASQSPRLRPQIDWYEKANGRKWQWPPNTTALCKLRPDWSAGPARRREVRGTDKRTALCYCFPQNKSIPGTP